MTSRELSIAGDATPRVERSPLLLAFYNLLYWPYLATTVALLYVPSLVLFLVTLPLRSRRRILHAYTCAWGAHYLAWAPFAGVRVEGRDRLAGVGPCVYVSNHQSMVDILAVFGTKLHFLWVSKIENFYVPFLGWAMAQNGYVRVKRGNLPSIRRMIRTCQRRLAEGDSLFVFPEGTRSPDGRLIDFKRGAFWLAARNRVPVVPILIVGSNRVLPKRSFRIVPQTVVVRILDPVYPADAGYDDRRLRDLVRQRMASEQQRLLPESKQAPAPVA
jgi:1-acyl-sn-glycerol-3-phosphate acyltransferase